MSLRRLLPLILLASSPVLPHVVDSPLGLALWPALTALCALLLWRGAAAGLAMGLLAGVLILENQTPLAALRAVFVDFVFPSMQGEWHLAALVFTLVLGAFAGLLEASGAFAQLLARWLQGPSAKRSEQRLLLGVYGMGLICFFDGLANSIVVGRVARPLVDQLGLARAKLAWITDSTSSPVACVAVFSTWVATQLSLIDEGVKNLPQAPEPLALFFASIPSNPYCLLTLLLVPVAIVLGYEPQAMRRMRSHAPPPTFASEAPLPRHEALGASAVPLSLSRALWPLLALVGGILLAAHGLSEPLTSPFTAQGWRQALSGNSAPFSLVVGALIGLGVAWRCYPKKARVAAGEAALHGAANLLPALVILILAWSLGAVFKALGAADALYALLATRVEASWLPIVVFITASVVAVATGSSWGTMGLLMPLVLPVAIELAPASALGQLLPAVIGAVFGGAVLGDHCSPFSDTTIVSALAAGCTPIDHFSSQLPFVLLAATGSAIAYVGVGLGLGAMASLALAGGFLMASLWVLARRQRAREKRCS